MKINKFYYILSNMYLFYSAYLIGMIITFLIFDINHNDKYFQLYLGVYLWSMLINCFVTDYKLFISGVKDILKHLKK